MSASESDIRRSKRMALGARAPSSLSGMAREPTGPSAGDRRVLELVEVGPTPDEVDDALDRGDREVGVALRPAHQANEHGLVALDEGGHAPHVAFAGGDLVFLAERVERPP